MEALFIGSESFLISVHAKSLLRLLYKWKWICHNALCSIKPGRHMEEWSHNSTHY